MNSSRHSRIVFQYVLPGIGARSMSVIEVGPVIETTSHELTSERVPFLHWNLLCQDVIPVKMVMSRIGRFTNGKFAHRVIPFVLERMLHPGKAIKLSL